MTAERLNLDTDYLVREYRAGRTAENIARQCGVSKGLVLRRLQEAGEPRRSRRLPLDVALLARLYAEGVSENQLSIRFGIDRNGIRRRLLEAGIQPRGRSAAEILKWSQMGPDRRRRQVAAAHACTKGRKMPVTAKLRAALTIQRTLSGMSRYDRALLSMLQERGLDCVPQQAIGPYNCDIAIGPVAVEIFGGQWHWHGHHLARTEARFRYLMQAGWHVLAIAVNKRSPLTSRVADYVVAYVEETRRNPTAKREYRVVWGAGEATISGCVDDDHISIEPPFTDGRDAGTGQYKRISR